MSQHHCMVVLLLLVVALLPTARSQQQPCPASPGSAALKAACGGARRASVGNCLVCAQTNFGSHCPNAVEFCEQTVSSTLEHFGAVLATASAGDLLVRGTTDWTVPSHRTVINVIDQFDADPTGATDSSRKVQLAVNTAAKLPNGGSVYIPAGNYQIQGITVASNVDVFGDSRSRTFCHTTSSNTSMFIVQNSMNVRIRDMWLVRVYVSSCLPLYYSR